jgi:DMSO/TMAO reductase YedYZ heme-binding membrane subunit
MILIIVGAIALLLLVLWAINSNGGDWRSK